MLNYVFNVIMNPGIQKIYLKPICSVSLSHFSSPTPFCAAPLIGSSQTLSEDIKEATPSLSGKGQCQKNIKICFLLPAFSIFLERKHSWGLLYVLPGFTSSDYTRTEGEEQNITILNIIELSGAPEPMESTAQENTQSS